MIFCTAVESEHILDEALGVVVSARISLTATMDVDEEVTRPLPAIYHHTVQEARERGVDVIRYGFGSKAAFAMISRYSSVQMHYAGPLEQYQRMLIADESCGIFRLGGSVYKTEFAPLAASLVKYVQSVYNKEAL